MDRRKIRNHKLFIEDILESIRNIEEYTRGMTFDEFSIDKKTKDAVIRNFEIIGEATNKIPKKVRIENSEIEWKSMVAFRNIIIHEYFGIDLDIMWNIIQTKLPILEKKIKELLEPRPE